MLKRKLWSKSLTLDVLSSPQGQSALFAVPLARLVITEFMTSFSKFPSYIPKIVLQPITPETPQ
jgi:hypothetical protein